MFVAFECKKVFRINILVVAVLALTLILTSEMGSFGPAFFLSVMLLPGVMFVKYFSGHISFYDRKKGVVDALCFAGITMLIEYFAIIFVYWNLYGFDLPARRSIVVNPLFIWFVLGALLSFEKLLVMKFI